jgi:hypothetical protein
MQEWCMTDEEFWKYERSLPRSVLVRLQYVEIGGDLATGMLLSQIVYWTKPAKDGKVTKMRVSKNGKLWIAKSQGDWLKETGITRHQYHQALKNLLDLGLIETERHIFKGVITPHIRLDLQVLRHRLEVHEQASSGNQTTEGGASSGIQTTIVGIPANQSSGFQTIITENTAENTTEIKKLAKDLGANMATSSEILEGLEVGKKKVKNDQNLEALWKNRVGTIYGGFQKQWTAEDRGKARHLKLQLGAQTVPVVDRVLQNWAVYCAYVQQTKGHVKAPAQPDLGYLLKYCDVAVQLIAVLDENVKPQPEVDIAVSNPQTTEKAIYKGPQAPVKTVLDDEDAAILAAILSGKG